MDIQTQLYITLGLMVFSGGLGFYMGERGFAGVRIDLENIKYEIEKVKNLVSSKTIPQAVTVVTPVGSPETPNTLTVGTPPSQ